MALDLSLPAIVNSGGGLLFAAVGVFAFATGAPTREARLIAALAIAFGVTYVVTNLWPFGTPGFPATVGVILSALVALLAIALGVQMTRALPPHIRRVAVALGLVLLASTAIFLSYGEPRVIDLALAEGVSAEEAKLIALGVGGVAASSSALAFMVAVSALVVYATPRENAPRRHAIALHACAYALFAVFAMSSVWPASAALNVLLLSALVPTIAWALASRDALGRRVTLALVAAGLGGVALSLAQIYYGQSPGTDFGSPGILRAVGAFLFALAILRHALVGDRAHPRAVRQGPLALGALVTLIIVAEVAQNFLSSQYGLLMGSLVAGALLVAARPIERALERRGQGHATVGAEGRSPRGGEATEASYRHALRLALRNHTLTRDEERGLLVLAHDLGIPPRRAHELQDEVEAEMRAAKIA